MSIDRCVMKVAGRYIHKVYSGEIRLSHDDIDELWSVWMSAQKAVSIKNKINISRVANKYVAQELTRKKLDRT